VKIDLCLARAITGAVSNQELLDRLNDDDFDEDEVHDFYREDAESEFYIGYNSGPLDSPTDYFGDDWF
jgi:hypothetical protein